MVLSAETKNGTPFGLIVFASLSTLHFPFAKLVWDELRDLAFGNNVIFMNASSCSCSSGSSTAFSGHCDFRCTDRNPVSMVPYPPAYSDRGRRCIKQAQTESEIMRKITVIVSTIVLMFSLPAKADRLICSESEHLRYMKMVGEVGEMGIDLNPVGEDRTVFERLTAAYETFDPKGPKTSLFVAYVPTGQMYSHTCAKVRCTMEEMARPEQACLIDHMNQCSYVALRFRGEEFCLLRAPQ